MSRRPAQHQNSIGKMPRVCCASQLLVVDSLSFSSVWTTDSSAPGYHLMHQFITPKTDKDGWYSLYWTNLIYNNLAGVTRLQHYLLVKCWANVSCAGHTWSACFLLTRKGHFCLGGGLNTLDEEFCLSSLFFSIGSFMLTCSTHLMSSNL